MSTNNENGSPKILIICHELPNSIQSKHGTGLHVDLMRLENSSCLILESTDFATDPSIRANLHNPQLSDSTIVCHIKIRVNDSWLHFAIVLRLLNSDIFSLECAIRRCNICHPNGCIVRPSTIPVNHQVQHLAVAPIRIITSLFIFS